MKILFGSIVVDARGRLNGHVFKKTQFGNSISALALPKNKNQWMLNSALQRNVAILRGWSTLTLLAKQQWAAFANANPITNQFGVLRNISAKSMYVKCTHMYSYPEIGVVPVDVASNVNPPCEIIPLGVSATTGKITYETSLITTNFQMVVYVQQIPNGNLVPRGNKWRRCPNVLINSIGLTTDTYNIFSLVGQPRAGYRYYIKYRIINSTGWGNAVFEMPLAVD